MKNIINPIKQQNIQPIHPDNMHQYNLKDREYKQLKNVTGDYFIYRYLKCSKFLELFVFDNFEF